MHKLIGIRVAAVIAIGTLLAIGCDSSAPGLPGEPSEASQIEAALVNSDTVAAGRELAASIERGEQRSDGMIRGAVSLAQATIDYYAVDTRAAESTVAALDLGDDPLEIIDYGPSGVLPRENAKPRIYVTFSQPMVPVAQLGEVITESPLLSISPAVEGTYRWYGTRTLSFEPAQPLIREPSYTVTVSGEAASLGGNTLTAPQEFMIFSERLELVNAYGGEPANPFTQTYNVPINFAKRRVLEFNQLVDPEVLARFLTVEIEENLYEFSLRRPDYPEEMESRRARAVELTLDEPPPENARVSIVLAEGAIPREGFPETVSEQMYSFWTISPFTVREVSSSSRGFPMDNRPFSFPIFVDFSHPLAEGMADEPFRVFVDGSPVEPTAIDQFYSDVRIHIPDASPGAVVSVEVPASMEDQYGRSLGEAKTVEHTIPRPSPHVSFPGHPTGLRHLEAEFDPAITFSMRNVLDFRLGSRGGERFFRDQAFPPLDSYDISEQQPDFVRFYEIDLEPFLNAAGRGVAYFNWAAELEESLLPQWRSPEVGGQIAVQVTDIGISARYGYNSVLVWANRLSDGSPIVGAEVELFNLYNASFTGRTDEEGLAIIPFGDGEFANSFYSSYQDEKDDLHIRVESGDDSAEVRVARSHNNYRFGAAAYQRPTDALTQRDRVHLFTDRGIYKPGEEFAFRGIHWLQNANGFTPAGGRYTVRIESAEEGTVIWRDEGTPSASGGFYGTVSLPESMEPGDYILRYHYGPGSREFQSVSFYVGSFRRVSFEVITRPEQEDILSGESASVTVEANYLAGGSVAGADYEYFWTRKPVRYVPPGPEWEHWSFGTTEWGSEHSLTGGEGTLSGSGTASVSVSTAEQELTDKSYRYTVEVRVEDIDRQLVAQTSSLLVHPATHYVGARFSQGASDGWWSRFVPTGEEVVAEARLVSIEGEELDLDRPIEYGLTKSEWKSVQQQGLYGRVNTRWERVEEPIFEESGETRAGVFEYTFRVEDPGSYTLYFVSEDGAGRRSRTEIPFYATGSGWVRTASETPSDIGMRVDKAIYEPGETARILVQSPIAEGRYLLTLEREGILDQRVIELSGSNEVIEVPVKEEYLPIFYVALTSFTERTEVEEDYFEPDLGKPRSLFGLTSVRVATNPVELEIDLSTDRPSYGPGDSGEVEVRVSQGGLPVADAEVTLLAVDRGVLDLIDYHIPDPLDYFYDPSHFPLGVEGDDSRRLLLRPVTYDISTLQGGDSAKLEERIDFTPLALFEPEVRTDDDGYARVSFEYPDNLTTYRITALALKENRLGLDEEEVRVQNPINVRTALPQRFRNRDTAAAGVVLTNTTATEQRIEVRAESDILHIADEAEKAISIPPNSVYELPFLLEAEEAGAGTIRFTIRSELLNEVLVSEVTVEEPLISEAVTTVGVVESDEATGSGSATEGIVIPSYAGDSYGTLYLSVGSSLRPYVAPSVERLEWSPGRITSEIRELYDSATRHLGYLPDRESRQLWNSLAAQQFENGGIGFRPESVGYSRPNLFLSLLTAHTARLATEATGGEVDLAVDMDSLRGYLRGAYREAADEEVRGFNVAWMAWLLAAEGVVAPRELDYLAVETDQLGIAGTALLAEAYLLLGDTARAGELYERNKNFIVIGTQTVDIRETYETRGYFDTGEAELAMMLRLGTLLDESEDLLFRLASSLNQTRTERRFHSPYDDFWILNGFAPFLRRDAEVGSGKGAGSGVVRLGERELIRHSFAEEGAVAEKELSLFAAPISELSRDELLSLTIESEDAGTLYYTSTLRYALPSETSLSRDEGIEVRRQIERLDGTVVEGNRLPLGETLRMRIFITTPRRLRYFNLTVPIPSGTDILDPNLRTSGSFRDAGGLQSERWERETVYGDTASFVADGYASYGPGAWSFWFYRPVQRVYENSMQYMWEDFFAGHRDVSFLFRTTTPGVFPTPPAQGFLEFEPEIFGRSSGTLYVIESE